MGVSPSFILFQGLGRCELSDHYSSCYPRWCWQPRIGRQAHHNPNPKIQTQTLKFKIYIILMLRVVAGPTNFGATVEASTPWLQLALYRAARSGPASLVLLCGQLFWRLPPQLAGCTHALLWPWDANAVRAQVPRPGPTASTLRRPTACAILMGRLPHGFMPPGLFSMQDRRLAKGQEGIAGGFARVWAPLAMQRSQTVQNLQLL